MSLVADASPFDLPPRPAPVWGTVASVVAHTAVLALLALLGATAVPLEPPVIESIAVDLISAAQFTALVGTAVPPPVPVLETTVPVPDAPVAADTPEPSATPAPSNGPFRATQFYAASLLADPANARLRRALGDVDAGERAVQLCDIEALEQIRLARPDYDPDTLVPYAMAEMAVSDGVLVAEGGAFRSRREWYAIRFRCVPAADLGGVESFEFTLGEAIPHEEWEAHYLTAAEGEE